MDLDLVIPTYNRSRLLADCLASVARARRPANLMVTVFVVDNNSTDNTKEAVRAFQQVSSLLVRYIFVPRPGKSAALNDVLPQTKAELIGLIDDDEQLAPGWFEVACREFTMSPETEYIGGPYLPNWEHEPPCWLPDSYRGAIGIVPRTERVAFSRQFSGMLMGGNVVIRKHILEKVLPYPEHLGKIGKKIRSGEDEVIYHRLLDLGAKGMVVPDLIISHWIPSSRMTKKYFRQWVVGRGIAAGMRLREHGFDEPAFLGIPKYLFSAAVYAAMSSLKRSSQKQRFAAQLSILDVLATLYGRYSPS